MILTYKTNVSIIIFFDFTRRSWLSFSVLRYLFRLEIFPPFLKSFWEKFRSDISFDNFSFTIPKDFLFRKFSSLSTVWMSDDIDTLYRRKVSHKVFYQISKSFILFLVRLSETYNLNPHHNIVYIRSLPPATVTSVPENISRISDLTAFTVWSNYKMYRYSILAVLWFRGSFRKIIQITFISSSCSVVDNNTIARVYSSTFFGGSNLICEWIHCYKYLLIKSMAFFLSILYWWFCCKHTLRSIEFAKFIACCSSSVPYFHWSEIILIALLNIFL